MRALLAGFLLAFFVAAVLTPLVRDMARRRRWLDDPREGRRVHFVPTPTVGGLAIAAGLFAPFAVGAAWPEFLPFSMVEDARRVTTLLIGAAAALGMGLADDLYETSPKLRLLALAALGAFAWFGGFRLDLIWLPGGVELPLGAFSLPVTVSWVVAGCVALNLIDGLDGLAAGVAAAGGTALAVLAWAAGAPFAAAGAACLAGASLGFLVYNRYPATIFMGDAGASVLGWVLATTTLAAAEPRGSVVGVHHMVLILAVPLLDTVLTVVRRAVLAEGMFLPERGHLHHRLLDSGLSHPRAVGVLWGAAAVLATSATVALTGTAVLDWALASAGGLALFAVLLRTGWVRPSDLARLLERRRANLGRIRRLSELAREVPERVHSEASADRRLARAFGLLAEGGAISGAMCGGDARWQVGRFDEEEKGVRYALSGERGEPRVRVFWAGRTSGPSPGEIRALRRLVDRLGEAGGSRP